MIPYKYQRFTNRILEGYDWKMREILEQLLEEIFCLPSKNYREIVEYISKIKEGLREKSYLLRILLAVKCVGNSKMFYYELKERGEKALKNLVETILRNYKVGGYV